MTATATRGAAGSDVDGHRSTAAAGLIPVSSMPAGHGPEAHLVRGTFLRIADLRLRPAYIRVAALRPTPLRCPSITLTAVVAHPQHPVHHSPNGPYLTCRSTSEEDAIIRFAALVDGARIR
jgi:hypothetical protein